jgi:hypothetical protein
VLDDAIGEQLDLLGAIVGEARNGRSDATYLLWIRSRILLNRASGLAEEIYDIFEPLLPAPVVPNLADFYPAALELTLAGGAVTEELVAQLALMLQEAKAAAVGAQLIWSPDPEDWWIRFVHPSAFLVAGGSPGLTSLTVSGVEGTFDAGGGYYIFLGSELLSVLSFDGTDFDLNDPTVDGHDGGELVMLAASGTAATGFVTTLLTGATAVVASGVAGTFPATGPSLIWVGGQVLQVASFNAATETFSLAAPYTGASMGGVVALHLDLANSLRIADVSTAHLAGGRLMGATVDGAAPWLAPVDTEWFPPDGGASPPAEEPSGPEPFVGPPL